MIGFQRALLTLRTFNNTSSIKLLSGSTIFNTAEKDSKIITEPDKNHPALGAEKGWFGNLFVRKLDHVKESQSDLLSDQNNVFELQMHDVRPDSMAEYLNAYDSFVKNLHDSKSGGRLMASWTVEIGEQDKAIHLWRFPGGYPVLNQHYNIYRNDKRFQEFRQKRNAMLRSRSSQICLPFSFWPPLKPRTNDDKHIYELRSYTLKPGAMIEWGNHWVRGIKFRSSEDEAVAGLFSHIGEMHVVHHIWVYKDLEHRKRVRDNSWRVPGWDECVLNTVPLIRHMSSSILQPTPFSPLQ